LSGDYCHRAFPVWEADVVGDAAVDDLQPTHVVMPPGGMTRAPGPSTRAAVGVGEHADGSRRMPSAKLAWLDIVDLRG
jgi:hypothetical protein